jgi:phospholipid/cholesterol/gamma-HCH transport system substrate-binding protein
VLPAGSQIPVDRTAGAGPRPAAGGLKPVIQGLNPQDVNALTSSLIQAFSRPGRHIDVAVRQDVVVLQLAGRQRPDRSAADRQPQHRRGGAGQGRWSVRRVDRQTREADLRALGRPRPIGTAITSLDNGTASLADPARRGPQPLANAVDQLGRLAPLLYNGKDGLEAGIKRMPGNYRKLVRLGAYGSFIQYYICGLSFRAPTYRAGPWSSRGSSKRPEGARSPDA